MVDAFKAVPVAGRVYWVGAIDWNIRNFHGYSTDMGTTYNAYLVVSDKITLVDTVKRPFMSEMLSRISSVVDPGRIDYIISNHSEMDHSGCLPEMIDLVKPEKVFASAKGAEALNAHFGIGEKITKVEDGSTLGLGGMDFTFLETRMLHWPDSMVSYLPAERILFSQDGFGMHLASSERFDDELDECVLEREAARYYANILLPYSTVAAKVLAKIENAGLEAAFIAPDHGPVWRGRVGAILDLYRKWSSRTLAKKAVIAFDSMWGSTGMMARAIEEGLSAGGVKVKVVDLGVSARSELATEVLDAAAVLFGTPTINGTIFPTVADALYYVRGLKPTGIIASAFGSYGWSGEAVGQVISLLREMKLDVEGEGIRARYVPDGGVLGKCRALGLELAERIDSVPGIGGKEIDPGK